MNRKKFFLSMGVGLLGTALLKTSPITKIFSKKEDEKQIKITPNPLAVSRKKIGDKNV
jgi:hypothetical protein